MSDESIKTPATFHNSLAPALHLINTKLRVKFNSHCLKQDKVTFTHKIVVNFHLVYEINLLLYIQGADFTLGNSLFGSARLNKNADSEKYFCSVYGNWTSCMQKFSVN